MNKDKRLSAACKNCGKQFKYSPDTRYGKYCSTACNGAGKRAERKKMWYDGMLDSIMMDRGTIRKYLIEDKGCICTKCGIGETYNGLPITLQVDHIDGNAGNNNPNNVRLLCPNCHSQTPFFSGANKGNGRKSRGLPLR